MTKPYAPLCKRVFNLLDQDGDGKITNSQLQSCIELIGCSMSAEEVEIVMSKFKQDQLVELDEFARLVESESEEEKTEDLRRVFRMYKMEGEGEGDECITPRSLKRVLGSYGSEWTLDECAAMIGHFDLNGDGVLNFQEIHHMMLLN